MMPEKSVHVDLLRKMAHDIRVPLNTLISTSDMLVDGVYDPLTSKQERAVVRLQRNNRRLLAILDDFVTYVKANAGDLSLSLKSFDPRTQLEAWCAPIQIASEEKGLKLTVTTSASVPAALTGDEVMLERIIQALLWNALAHTTQGEIWVTSDWIPAQNWVVCVKDTGSGIPDKDVPQIFEPFWRGEERPQLPTAGAGLGLPLSRALAMMMGGNLILRETGPSGSAFCVEIPINSLKPATEGG